MDWILSETERKQLESLNSESCSFRINEENVISGLSLRHEYYRECAHEFLRYVKSL